MTGEAVRLLGKSGTAKFAPAEAKSLKGFQDLMQKGARFIPTWAKISVAIALAGGLYFVLRHVLVH